MLRKEIYQNITLIKENFVTMNNPEKLQFLCSLSETEQGTMSIFWRASFPSGNWNFNGNQLCSITYPGYMINTMILTSTLSIFHSFPATYHLALLMVCTFHSSLDMHDAAHTMRISDIVTSAWLIDFCHKAIRPWALRSLSKNFMADIRISLRNTRGQSMLW